jgi:hypothetical protein
MKQLPDILTSAGFWASIATLWGAAGAWATFVSAEIRSRQQTYEGVNNLIAGIEAELSLVEDWASGKEGDVGYLQSKSFDELAKEHTDWFNPSRQIFSFDTPALSGFTNSPYIRLLSSVIPAFVRLNHSIRALFDFVKIYQTFVHADPALYSEVFTSVSAGKRPPTDAGTIYSNIVFGMNKTIHQDLIGGIDSQKVDCLYKAFRRARKTLEEFKGGWRREALPKWYWVLHVLAVFLALNGAWQVWRWMRGLCG